MRRIVTPRHNTTIQKPPNRTTHCATVVAGGGSHASEHHASDAFVANEDEHCEGKYLEPTTKSKGSFTVFNSRNNFVKICNPNRL